MNSQPQLIRGLGLVDATSIVAGTIIGTGIFLTPSAIARSVDSVGLVFLLWIFGGLLSLAASTVVDFYQPMTGGKTSDAKLLKLSRWLTVVWGVLLVGMALLAQNWGPVLEAGLTIASFTYGALLGVFLLGRLVKRASPAAAASGMVAGLALIAYVKFFTPLAWTWYVPLGSLATFLVGWSLTFVLPKRNHNA